MPMTSCGADIANRSPISRVSRLTLATNSRVSAKRPWRARIRALTIIPFRLSSPVSSITSSAGIGPTRAAVSRSVFARRALVPVAASNTACAPTSGLTRLAHHPESLGCESSARWVSSTSPRAIIESRTSSTSRM